MVSTLSRTSSAASLSSISDDGTIPTTIRRRPRKRFSNVQLMMLEDLFHQKSHPSRGERDAVAKLGDMEAKSVTVWFQNKRQTERRALHNATNTASSGRSSHNPPPAAVNTSASSCTVQPITSSRLSLDRVASRSELRTSTPRTPTRKHNSHSNVWENMPSSPIAPPFSPPSMEYVEYGKAKRTKRTLEWACAAARLADKQCSGVPNKKEESDSTEDEAHEAITPPSTWGKGDLRWTNTQTTLVHKAVQDDDEMMKAALALCGLGRHRS